MSINIEKIDAPKRLNVDTFNENNSGFNIRHNDDFLNHEPMQPKQNLGLDFLTGNDHGDFEQDHEQDPEQEYDNDPIMNEPYGGEQDYEEEMSNEEIQQKKAFALYNLERLRKQGYELSRNFGINHSLIELETELTRIEMEKNLDNGLQHCKDTLLLVTKAIETVNVNYGPQWIKLNGWSAFILEEYKTHKYDDCLIKLWQKYSSKLPDSPEFTLIWLLGTSAVVFHMSRIAAEQEMKKRQPMFQKQEMTEPSMNFDDFDVSGSDTNSVISGTSGVSGMSFTSNLSQHEVDNTINISIPDKSKPKKQRGRPKKIKEM